MAAALVCAGMLFAGGGQDSKAAANKSGSKELTVAIWDKNQEPGLTKILTSGQAKQAPNRSATTSPPKRKTIGNGSCVMPDKVRDDYFGRSGISIPARTADTVGLCGVPLTLHSFGTAALPLQSLTLSKN